MRFQEHVELLRLFLKHRGDIVERIGGVVSALRKPMRYDQARLSRDIEDCFFEHAAGQAHLRGQLEATHRFQPRAVEHVHNDLIDPAEMMLRAVHCWQQTWWPGRGGRTHYAHTLFNVYVLRSLQFLSLRVFDDDPSERLAEVQSLLDELWGSSPAGQPAMVRDARWLIPLAQSLITDQLAPYFEVALLVADSLPEADVLEIQRAHVRMLGGHLASQIRYYCTKDGVSMDELNVVVGTRTANALDLALLVQGLVGLLKAYERALHSGDERMRLDMAGAIFQGVSADPELFLNRVELLRAYSMVEGDFIAVGGSAYSVHGQRHVELCREYEALVGRLIEPLREDLPRFRPVAGRFSPYGVVHGLPSNLIEHMALKALQPDAETRFSLEDVFDDRDTRAAKLAWVNGWRDLPHIPREVQRLYAYPQEFAEEIYERIGRALHAVEESRTGCLYIGPGAIPELPDRYFARGSDGREQLLAGRQEGHFLVSYETPGGWVALKKDLLTEVLGAGLDARIVGLPPEAAKVLRIMCGELVVDVAR
ncbi:MAG: hypothetical protein ABIR70_18185 [Bryobacteraceae bacterium]